MPLKIKNMLFVFWILLITDYIKFQCNHLHRLSTERMKVVQAPIQRMEKESQNKQVYGKDPTDLWKQIELSKDLR